MFDLEGNGEFAPYVSKETAKPQFIESKPLAAIGWTWSV